MRKGFFKKLGIALLSVATLFSFTTGIALWNGEVKAEGTTIAPSAIVSSENGTVTATEGTGVTVAADAAYSGTVKGIFEGDSTFKFLFPEAPGSTYDGQFTVKVADALDPTNAFEVRYSATNRWSGGGYTGAYVYYGSEIRSSKFYDYDTVWYNATAWGDTVITSPTFGGPREGVLEFVWTDDVLSVKINRHDGSSTRVIAAFDGTDSFVSGTSWGLPKLSFENGYVVSFASTYSTGTDVLFTSVAGVDMTQASVEKPAFVTAYEELEEQIKAEEEAKIAASNEIKQSALDTEETVVLDATGAKVTADAGYTGKIRGVFTEDTTINFGFPESGGNFVFTFTDVNDSANFFTVKYVRLTQYFTGVYCYYGDQVRTVQYNNSNTWYNYEVGISDATWIGTIARPNIHDATLEMADLKLVWNGDVLSVVANCNGTMSTVMAFDGTSEFVSGTSWGLPKIGFTDGYTVSFASTNSDVLFASITSGSESCDFTAVLASKPSFITAYDELEEQLKAEQAAKEAASNAIKQSIVSTTATKTGSANGLFLESDVAYSGAFVGSFTGDTEIGFAFPEVPEEGWYEGQFTFRVADATNPSNYFEVEYTPSWRQGKDGDTRAYVLYGDQMRSSKYYGGVWFNQKSADDFVFPAFINGGKYNKSAEGVLRFTWTGDVLSVGVGAYGGNPARTIAAFDGTSEFVSGTSWGLPKMNFENGYTISFSSSFSRESMTDKATDVMFKSVTTGGVKYDLTSILTETPAFATPIATVDGTVLQTVEGKVTLPAAKAEEGKVFLGYKNVATGALYRANENVTLTENVVFEPVSVGVSMLAGASVRISETQDDSGIRFTTLYSAADFEANAAYIKSFGTVIALTQSLASTEFILDNFVVGQTIAKIESTKNFEYDEDYYAYTAALITIKEANIAASFSARAYIEVEYHDGTGYVYSSYVEADNARSIAEVAYKLQTNADGGEDEYAELNATEKAIVDAYAAKYSN